MTSAATIRSTLAAAAEAYRHEPINFLDRTDPSDEWDYVSGALPSYERTLVDLVDHHGDLAGRRILEIGPYFGVLALAMARLGAKVTVFDLPAYLGHPRLRQRLEAAGVTCSPGDLREGRLAFADGAFDTVVMCETLEHLNFNPLPCLAETNRALAGDGLLYLSLPNLASLSNRKRMLLGQSYHNPIDHFFLQLDPHEDFAVGLHWREYTAAEIRELVGRLGFQVVRQYYHHSPADRLLPRLAYSLVPTLRPNLTTLARKTAPARLPGR